MNPIHFVIMLYALDIILTNLYVYLYDKKGIDGLKLERNFIPKFIMRKVKKKYRIITLLAIFIPLFYIILYYEPGLIQIFIGVFLLVNYMHILNFINYLKVRKNDWYWILLKEQIKEIEKIKNEN